MRTYLHCVILALITLVHPAKAQDRNDLIMQKLYSKLSNVLGVNNIDGASQVDALVLAAPGFVLDESINYDNPNGRKIVFDLIDGALQPSWILRFSGAKTSDIYSKILDDHESPKITMSTDQKTQLARARTIIFDQNTESGFSQRYRNFVNARTTLATAMDTVQTWQRANPNEAIPAAMIAKLDEARERYELVSEKNTIIAAMSIINSMESLDPNVYWGKLRVRYNANTMPVGGTPVPIYSFYPVYKSWLDESLSRTTISFNDSDVNNTTTKSTTSWNAGGSGRWGLWSVGGNYGQTDTRSTFSLDAQTFSVVFEVLRVKIDRPWMDQSVFGARTWRWQTLGI